MPIKDDRNSLAFPDVETLPNFDVLFSLIRPFSNDIASVHHFFTIVEQGGCLVHAILGVRPGCGHLPTRQERSSEAWTPRIAWTKSQVTAIG